MNESTPAQPVHLFVVADDDGGPDPAIDCAFLRARPEAPFLVTRCAHPGELVGAVADALPANAKIATLDLYDHGARGIQNMGGIEPTARLFDYTGLNLDVVDALVPYLTEDAHLRLLGCNTGRDVRGRELLLGIQGRLGEQRLAFGTLTHIFCWVFGRTGFDADFAHFLASARDVEMGPIDDWEHRIRGFADVTSDDLAVKVHAALRRIELRLQNPETGLASCCAR